MNVEANALISLEVLGWSREEINKSIESAEAGLPMEKPILNYLENDGDAMSLVKVMNEKGYFASFFQTDELGYGIKVTEDKWWTCSFFDEHRNTFSAMDKSLSMAICLAALKTVGVDITGVETISCD